MNQTVNEKNLSTADLLQATKAPTQDGDDARGEPESLVALFTPDVAESFQSRWDSVQIGFVDDPKQAVQKADQLVAEVMTSLAETFAKERSQLEGLMDGSSDSATTENLRVALQRYRSFFQRLLTL
jgi:hypothetical protein